MAGNGMKEITMKVPKGLDEQTARTIMTRVATRTDEVVERETSLLGSVAEVIGVGARVVGSAVGLFVVPVDKFDAGVFISRHPLTQETTIGVRELWRTKQGPPYSQGRLMLKFPWETHISGYDMRTWVDIHNQSTLTPEVQGLGKTTVIEHSRAVFEDPLVALGNGYLPDDARKVGETSVLDGVVGLTTTSDPFKQKVNLIIDDPKRQVNEKIIEIDAYMQRCFRLGVVKVTPAKTGLRLDEGLTAFEIGTSPETQSVIEAQAEAGRLKAVGYANAAVAGKYAEEVTEGISKGAAPIVEALVKGFSAVRGEGENK